MGDGHYLWPWPLIYWPEYQYISSIYQGISTYQVTWVIRCTRGDGNNTFCLDLCYNDLNINTRGHLLIKDYLPSLKLLGQNVLDLSNAKCVGRTRQIIQYRATVTLWRPPRPSTWLLSADLNINRDIYPPRSLSTYHVWDSGKKTFFWVISCTRHRIQKFCVSGVKRTFNIVWPCQLVGWL